MNLLMGSSKILEEHVGPKVIQLESTRAKTQPTCAANHCTTLPHFLDTFSWDGLPFMGPNICCRECSSVLCTPRGEKGSAKTNLLVSFLNNIFCPWVVGSPECQVQLRVLSTPSHPGPIPEGWQGMRAEVAALPNRKE